jgi:hypothetical protein
MNTFKRYFLKLLFITISMLILAAPLVWLQIYYPHRAYSVSGFVTGHFWEFTVFRLFLIAGFFMTWSRFIQYCAKRHQWESAKTQFWLAQRFRITVWLLIFEVLAGQNILAHWFG